MGRTLKKRRRWGSPPSRTPTELQKTAAATPPESFTPGLRAVPMINTCSNISVALRRPAKVPHRHRHRRNAAGLAVAAILAPGGGGGARSTILLYYDATMLLCYYVTMIQCYCTTIRSVYTTMLHFITQQSCNPKPVEGTTSKLSKPRTSRLRSQDAEQPRENAQGRQGLRQAYEKYNENSWASSCSVFSRLLSNLLKPLFKFVLGWPRAVPSSILIRPRGAQHIIHDSYVPPALSASECAVREYPGEAGLK